MSEYKYIDKDLIRFVQSICGNSLGYEEILMYIFESTIYFNPDYKFPELCKN